MERKEKRQPIVIFPFSSSLLVRKPKVENVGKMCALSESEGKTIQMDCKIKIYMHIWAMKDKS